MTTAFVQKLEAYTASLRASETALQNFDVPAVLEAGQQTTEHMVGMLQDLDGRLERVERRPANDA